MVSNNLRDCFRSYALDGAIQYFHPNSGTQVRISNFQTKNIRKRAPRVVMFGITNYCNLSCHFCSRDEKSDSLWTNKSAFTVLKDLSDAGVLEVAFGGGEPFAFPDFASLISNLYDQTPLALNVTTNGTLISHNSWLPYIGKFGQVRVSVYGDTVWRKCAEIFGNCNQLWGANILVDNDSLETLPKLLHDLTLAGCHDVSLLNFVGEPTKQLNSVSRKIISKIVSESPLPCRISVCFGSLLKLPRLFAGFDNDGDCGAGNDFITVTPDQRVQACSFQNNGYSGATANKILEAWKNQRSSLSMPASRIGCARLNLFKHEVVSLPEISIWKGFSGNNSGECIMVAKFQSVKNASEYLSELLPGWQSKIDKGGRYSDEWRELFISEQVAGVSMYKNYSIAPDEIVQLGPTVLALGYGSDDNFPELRALSWKRGAFVLPHTIHIHDNPVLIGAIAVNGEKDRSVLVQNAKTFGLDTFIHGQVVILHPKNSSINDLKSIAKVYLELAGERKLSADLYCFDWSEADLVDALQHIGLEVAQKPRLWLQFFPYGENKIQSVVKLLNDQKFILGPDWILVDPVIGRKRIAVMAYRNDADVSALDVNEVIVVGYFSHKPQQRMKGANQIQPETLTVETLQKTFLSRSDIIKNPSVNSEKNFANQISVSVLTSEPDKVLNLMLSIAKEMELDLWPSIKEPKPMRSLINRLIFDLK